MLFLKRLIERYLLGNISQSGYLIFDYCQMDTLYGQQAFEAIHECLIESKGKYYFNDGDLDCHIVQQLANKSTYVKPASHDSPLAKMEKSFDIGMYVVSMWANNCETFEKLHMFFISNNLKGYLGYFTLEQENDLYEFTKYVSNELLLPPSMIFVNGNIAEGTSKYGIGMNPQNSELLSAAARGDNEAVKAALAAGADVNCIDPIEHSLNPLLHAIENIETVSTLLKNGADPNYSNGVNTALMLASRLGCVEVVKKLLEYGADPTIESQSGDTALKWADTMDYGELVIILREAMIKHSQKNL